MQASVLTWGGAQVTPGMSFEGLANQVEPSCPLAVAPWSFPGAGVSVRGNFV